MSGGLTTPQFKTLRAPMTIDGYRLNPVRVEAAGREKNGDTWLSMTLTEGRKRQIRHMLAAIGKRAVRLIRIRIGPVRLGDLAAGKLRHLTAAEIAHWGETQPDPSAEDAPSPLSADPPHGRLPHRLSTMPTTKADERPLAGSTHRTRRRARD